MSELAGKEELYAGLAGGLEALIAQREAEPLDVQLERELNDPNRSLTALMQEQEKTHGGFYKPSEPNRYARAGSYTDDILSFRQFIYRRLHAAASETKWADIVYERETGRVAPDSVDLFMYAAVSKARKQLLQKDDHLARMEGLFVAAYVASQTMPEGYDEIKRPKKHKNESHQDVLFRKSISILYDLIKAPKSRDHKRFSAVIDRFGQFKNQPEAVTEEMFNNVMTHPDNDDVRRGFSDMHVFLVARNLLQRLAEPEYTPDTVREEDYKFAQLKQLRETSPPEPDVKETKWTILPPGTMEDLEKTGKTGGGDSPYFVDPARIKWLAHLATSWGPDAYIAIADLDNNGDTQYLAAILPQHIDGVAVEHAVAENASSHNATYAFRAERGMDDGNTPWLTWKDVLSDTRSGARALGARKILHGNYWDENVHEYLTRPPEDLDKKDYKR